MTGCGSCPSLRRWSRARFWPGRRPRSFLPPLLPCCDLPRNTSAEYQTIRYRHWTRRSSRFRMEASCGDVSTFCPEVRAMTIQEASECDQISMEVLRSGRPRPERLNLILTLRDIGFTGEETGAIGGCGYWWRYGPPRWRIFTPVSGRRHAGGRTSTPGRRSAPHS